MEKVKKFGERTKMKLFSGRHRYLFFLAGLGFSYMQFMYLVDHYQRRNASYFNKLTIMNQKISEVPFTYFQNNNSLVPNKKSTI